MGIDLRVAVGRVAVGIAGIAALGMLTACGSDSGSNATSSSSASSSEETTETTAESSFDVGDLEDRISDKIGTPSGSRPASVEDVKVSCPSDTKPANGETVECDVKATATSDAPQPGAPIVGTATVTFKDASGDKASLAYEIKGPGLQLKGTVPNLS